MRPVEALGTDRRQRVHCSGSELTRTPACIQLDVYVDGANRPSAVGPSPRPDLCSAGSVLAVTDLLLSVQLPGPGKRRRRHDGGGDDRGTHHHGGRRIEHYRACSPHGTG